MICAAHDHCSETKRNAKIKNDYCTASQMIRRLERILRPEMIPKVSYKWSPDRKIFPGPEIIPKLNRKWFLCWPQMIPLENKEWHGVFSFGPGFNVSPKQKQVQTRHEVSLPINHKNYHKNYNSRGKKNIQVMKQRRRKHSKATTPLTGN